MRAGMGSHCTSRQPSIRAKPYRSSAHPNLATPNGISSTMAADVLGMAFVPYYKHIMTMLETNDELKKTATGIFKQVAWGAGGTIAGGVVGGPVGAMAGGLAGSVVGYYMSDEYQSMIKTLKELTDEDKQKLVRQVQRVVGSAGREALTRFIGTKAQREILLNLLKKFITNLKGE